MKIKIRATSFYIIFTIYGLAVSYCNCSSLFLSSNKPIQSNTEHHEELFIIPSHIHSQDADRESSVSVESGSPVISTKNTVNKFACSLNTIEHSILNKYSQYCFFSRLRIIRFITPDIIFPSHYFW